MRYFTLALLITIMMLVTTVTAIISLWQMYDTAVKEQQARLLMNAHSQAMLFETMYRHDKKLDIPNEILMSHLLEAIEESYENYRIHGESGEYVMARREGDSIVFLFGHRHGDLSKSKSIPWDAPLGEPMRRALSGKTGSIIALDYRNEKVVAAYKSVQLDVPMGIVAKMDLKEIRAPFIRTAVEVLGIGLLLVLAGSLLFFRVIAPLIRRITVSEARHRALLAAVPEIVAETDTNRCYTWFNKAGLAFFGSEALGKKANEYFIGKQNTYDIVQPLLDGSDKTIYIESLQRGNDGKAHLLAWHSKALKNRKNEVTGILSTARDITDIRKTALHNRLILEAAGEGIFGLDIEGRHTFVNPAASHMLGWSGEELIGQKSHPMWHHTKEDGSPFPEKECPITGVLKNGTVHNKAEDIFWRKDGTPFPARYTSTPIFENGSVAGAVVIFEDITREKNDREQLEQLNHILRLLSLGNQIMVRCNSEVELLKEICDLFTQTGLYPAAWIVLSSEQESKFPHAVAAAGISDDTLANIMQQGEEEKSPLPLMEAIRTQEAQIFNEITSPKLPHLCQETAADIGASSLAVFPFEIKHGERGAIIICANNSHAFGQKEIELFKELSGDLAYGMNTLKVRKEKEKSQKESRLFRELLNHSNDAIFLIEPRNGTIFDVNDRACKRLGYSREELLKMHVFELEATLPDKDKWQEHLKIFQFEDAQMIEGVHQMKDGTTFPVEVSIRYIRDKRQDYMISIARDITERKVMEKELKQKEEMMLAQSRQAAMGDMIAMIAHQWRQPITVVAMAVNNIKLQIELGEEITDDNLLGMTDTVTKQTQHLSKTIDDFRNFFKPNREKEKTTVTNVLNDTLKIIGKSLENNNIEIVVEDQDGSTIQTYPNELLQVFLNILSNAKDVLKDNSVEDARIAIMIEETDTSSVTTICDNGGGISKEAIKRLAEPYFTTKKKTGTGLGLYMSKTIVEKHLEGTLSWENNSEGACFIITLPLK